jgi:hypothetical protein
MNIVVPKSALLLIAADLKTNFLDGSKLWLYQNDYTPNPNTALADLIVADYAGFAAKTIAAWGTAFVDVNGEVISLAPLETFTCTGGGMTNTIYGCYLTDATGAILTFAARFDAPFGMAISTDAIPFVPRFLYGSVPA